MAIQSKAEVRDNFRKQIDKLKENADHNDKADRLEPPEPRRNWERPKDWGGDPTDLQGMATPFDRSQNNDDFVQAVSDGQNPGTTGDMIVSTLQIDYLAMQERAFRCRYCSYVRGRMHAVGRRKGHGNSSGLFSKAVLGYVEGLLGMSKK